MFACPVCGYNALTKPAKDHSICPCCGVEFGYDDAGPRPLDEIHASLRSRWIALGAVWHSRRVPPPNGWNYLAQLDGAHLVDEPVTAPEEVRVAISG